MDDFNHLLDDAAIYAPPVVLTLLVQHLVLARPRALPATPTALIGRYAAGSAAVAASVSCYALRRPEATASDAAALTWMLLLAGGAAVAAAHAVSDAVEALRAAERRRVYEEEREHGGGIPGPFRRIG